MTIIERCAKFGFARLLFVAVAAGLAFAPMSMAQENPFAPGWALNAEASNIRFQSVKKQTKVESSSFATFSGSIEEDGRATIKVLLDSVDTKIDLRSVRMRFLFFETFKFPEATITLQLSPDMISGLKVARRMSLIVPYVFDLHGVTKGQILTNLPASKRRRFLRSGLVETVEVATKKKATKKKAR